MEKHERERESGRYKISSYERERNTRDEHRTECSEVILQSMLTRTIFLSIEAARNRRQSFHARWKKHARPIYRTTKVAIVPLFFFGRQDRAEKRMAIDLDDSFENNENQMNIFAKCRIVSNGREAILPIRGKVRHMCSNLGPSVIF